MERMGISAKHIPKEEERSFTFRGVDNLPLLELKGNGDILVKGKLIENDKEVVSALREFLQSI